jgi:cephalosporin hydroxylase
MDEHLTLNTDKHTTHSYIPIYEFLFSPIRDSCKAILEIGVQTGGSMKLWNGYFPNAIVYGIDCDIYNNRFRDPAPRIRYIQADAYTTECASTFADNSLDIIIDDGPHTLESMCQVIDLYYRAVAPGGYLIIEDVQDIEWIPTIRSHVDPNAKWSVFDRRDVKGRYDDILIVIQKPTNPN